MGDKAQWDELADHLGQSTSDVRSKLTEVARQLQETSVQENRQGSGRWFTAMLSYFNGVPMTLLSLIGLSFTSVPAFIGSTFVNLTAALIDDLYPGSYDPRTHLPATQVMGWFLGYAASYVGTTVLTRMIPTFFTKKTDAKTQQYDRFLRSLTTEAENRFWNRMPPHPSFEFIRYEENASFIVDEGNRVDVMAYTQNGPAALKAPYDTVILEKLHQLVSMIRMSNGAKLSSLLSAIKLNFNLAAHPDRTDYLVHITFVTKQDSKMSVVLSRVNDELVQQTIQDVLYGEVAEDENTMKMWETLRVLKGLEGYLRAEPQSARKALNAMGVRLPNDLTAGVLKETTEKMTEIIFVTRPLPELLRKKCTEYALLRMIRNRDTAMNSTGTWTEITFRSAVESQNMNVGPNTVIASRKQVDSSEQFLSLVRSAALRTMQHNVSTWSAHVHFKDASPPFGRYPPDPPNPMYNQVPVDQWKELPFMIVGCYLTQGINPEKVFQLFLELREKQQQGQPLHVVALLYPVKKQHQIEYHSRGVCFSIVETVNSKTETGPLAELRTGVAKDVFVQDYWRHHVQDKRLRVVPGIGLVGSSINLGEEGPIFTTTRVGRELTAEQLRLNSLIVLRCLLAVATFEGRLQPQLFSELKSIMRGQDVVTPTLQNNLNRLITFNSYNSLPRISEIQFIGAPNEKDEDKEYRVETLEILRQLDDFVLVRPYLEKAAFWTDSQGMLSKEDDHMQIVSTHLGEVEWILIRLDPTQLEEPLKFLRILREDEEGKQMGVRLTVTNAVDPIWNGTLQKRSHELPPNRMFSVDTPFRLHVDIMRELLFTGEKRIQGPFKDLRGIGDENLTYQEWTQWATRNLPKNKSGTTSFNTVVLVFDETKHLAQNMKNEIVNEKVYAEDPYQPNTFYLLKGARHTPYLQGIVDKMSFLLTEDVLFHHSSEELRILLKEKKVATPRVLIYFPVSATSEPPKEFSLPTQKRDIFTVENLKDVVKQRRRRIGDYRRRL